MTVSNQVGALLAALVLASEGPHSETNLPIPHLFSSVVSVIVGVGALAAALAAFAYWLFKLFAEKWLSARFNERLEDYRHAHGRELEKLKLQINTLMDRTIKLHQFEFDVLPEAWKRLNLAFSHTASFVSPMQSFSDLNRMGVAEREHFITNSELYDWEKDQLRSSADPNGLYPKLIFWHRHSRVQDAYRDFHNYLVTNGIFIQPSLKKKFLQLSEILNAAIMERELVEEGVSTYKEARPITTRVTKEGQSLCDAIEAEVAARLWDTKLPE